jgi:hypothetical protein
MADNTDVFAESESLEKRLLAQLAAAPVVEVQGVVGPSGACAGMSYGDKLWTLVFSFDAWRIEGAEIQTQPLTIRRKAPHEDLPSFSVRITPYTVLRIRARVVGDSVFQNPQALLEHIVGLDDSDITLNEHAKQLQKPVTYEDAILGAFTLDRRLDRFTTDTVWNGAPVSLNLSAKEPADLQEALKTAHSLWETQDMWNQRIRDYAVQELLSLKNGDWLGDDEAEITADQFKDRMTLEAITVYPDGSFVFWHDDGNLFWGHCIQISGSLSEGPTDADIPG